MSTVKVFEGHACSKKQACISKIKWFAGSNTMKVKLGGSPVSCWHSLLDILGEVHFVLVGFLCLFLLPVHIIAEG